MTEIRLAQRFAVQSEVEESKLGRLVLAHDERTGRLALVLALSAETRQDDTTLQAIVDENGQLAQCPDALLTYAWGRDADVTWLATEAVGGPALGELFKRRVGNDAQGISAVALPLSRALAEATACGILHLDVRPTRILLDGDDLTQATARVFGFGWWRLLPAYETSTAADAIFYGTPEYMAAEMCKGVAGSAPSDLYSAAMVVYALAAGKPAFRSTQALMTLKRQAIEKPLRLDLVKPALKGVKDLQAALGGALEKDPAKRPEPGLWAATIADFAGQWATEVAARTPAMRR